MGLFDSGGSTTVPLQIGTLSLEQQALMDSLLRKTQRATNEPAPSYPREMYVPRTPEEEAYFNEAANTPNVYGDMISGKPAYDVSSTATENLWQNKMEPLYAKEHAAMLESLAGLGETSSSARGVGESDFFSNKAAAHSQLLYNDELARRTALENAANRVVPARTAEMGELGTAGQYSRQIKQEEIASNLQRWLSGEAIDNQYNPVYNPQMQLALSLLGFSQKAIGAQTESSGPGMGTSFVQGAGAGVGAIAAAAAASY